MANRFLMWLLLTFTAVMLFCTFLNVQAILLFALLLMIALLVASFLKFKWKPTVLGCIISAIFSIGVLLFAIIPSKQLQGQLLDQEAVVRGQVVDIGSNSAQTLTQYRLRLMEVNGRVVSGIHPFYVYLYTDSTADHSWGSVLEGSMQFFDHEVEYGAGREDSVLVSAYQGLDGLTLISPSTADWRTALDRFRTAVQNRVMYGAEETQALLRSVCFGDKSKLEPSLAVSLRRDGLSHVNSVSGLHLTFAVLLFNYLFLLAGVSYRIRYLLGIAVAVFFTVLVGFPASCVRACVMLIIFSIGMAIDEFADGMTSLSIAAFLIVLVQPLAVRDVGFLLSVLATAGIILLRAPVERFLFPPKIREKSPRLNTIYRGFTGIISCSVAVSITTLPITLFVFRSISLVAPIANAVLIYPFQLLFMLGIFMILLGFIPAIGSGIGFLCDLLYEWIKVVAEFLGRLPFASVSALNFFGVVMVALFLSVLAVSLYHYLKYHKRSFWALFSAFVCFCGMYGGLLAFARGDERLEIAFIDVGQGDCTVLSKDHRAVILDYGGSSMDRYHLIEYLQSKNIYTVELLAFTHLHDDHINGLSTLLGNVYVDQIIYPELEFDSPKIYGIMVAQNAKAIKEDAPITILDDVLVTPMLQGILDPSLETVNERCVCYRVDYGATSLLVTGDLEARGEMKSLLLMEDCTLLKVAHHGSKTSSMYPFLKAVSPEIAIISVGENSYGLPDESVLKRLETICPTIYNTNTDGSIVFQTDGAILERISK